MLLQKAKNVVVKQGQIGRDDEINFFPFLRRFHLRGLDNFRNERKVEKRLSALELDFDAVSRGSARAMLSALFAVLAHVEARAVGALARHLAIRARVFAPKRNHKHVQARWLAKECHPAPQPHREQLKLSDLPVASDKICRVGSLVETIARRNTLTQQGDRTRPQ